MIAAFCAFVVIGQEATTPPDMRIPEWATVAIALLKKEGLLTGHPDGFHHRHPATRYEYAVATHASHAYLVHVIKATQSQIAASKRTSFRLDDAWREDLLAIAGWKPRVKDLVRLATEFDRELISLGVQKGFASEVRKLDPAIDKLVHSIDSFSDVPQGHWAADSVHALRRAGILAGYPNNRFRSPRL